MTKQKFHRERDFRWEEALVNLALESDIGLISNTVSTTKGALMGKLCTPYANLTRPVFGPKV